MSNSPGPVTPVHVKQESAESAAGFPGGFPLVLAGSRLFNIRFKATLKIEHIEKKELDEAVKTGDLHRATVAISEKMWVEPHDCWAERGILHPEYNVLDQSQWI